MQLSAHTGAMTLKEFDILWAVRELGEAAYLGAIQRKVESIHVAQHKQNFRRTVAMLAAQGLLEFMPGS